MIYKYCKRCGKRLKSDENRQRGFGEKCFEKAKMELLGMHPLITPPCTQAQGKKTETGKDREKAEQREKQRRQKESETQRDREIFRAEQERQDRGSEQTKRQSRETDKRQGRASKRARAKLIK